MIDPRDKKFFDDPINGATWHRPEPLDSEEDQELIDWLNS